MTKTPKAKRPKPTDAERHALFVDTARAVGASDDPKDFEEAFGKVTKSPQPKNA
jgi:hypothetical protein